MPSSYLSNDCMFQCLSITSSDVEMLSFEAGDDEAEKRKHHKPFCLSLILTADLNHTNNGDKAQLSGDMRLNRCTL